VFESSPLAYNFYFFLFVSKIKIRLPNGVYGILIDGCSLGTRLKLAEAAKRPQRAKPSPKRIDVATTADKLLMNTS
jgi:hypothetical protein